MFTGKILLTDFAMEAGMVTLNAPDGSRETIGLVALLFAGDDNPKASITIPMTPDSVIALMVQIAGFLTSDQRTDLLAKLSVKGILLAKPGDEATVARNLRSV